MFPSWFRRKRSSRDFEAEIEAHLQLEADALAEQGLGGEQARSAAHRAFGNTASAQERFWEATHWVGLDAFWRDVRYATRCLRKTPSFTLTAIITLAVAIAANAVVFGALNAVILRPLNVPQAQTLYALQPRLHDTSLRLSYPAAGTALLAGRRLDWSDDATAAKVALVNQQFARQLFGSTTAAVGSYFKLHDGTRIEVAGVVENGKYNSLTEAQQPAMFLPLLQWPSSSSVMIVRSPLNPQTLVLAIKGKLRSLDPGLPSFIETWNQAMTGALFAARVAASALGLLGLMGVILSLTGIFGLAAAAVSKRRPGAGDFGRARFGRRCL